MKFTWYATNNYARLDDLEDLGAIGVRVLKRSPEPMTFWRDYESGLHMVKTGAVWVFRDGRINVRPRLDAPPVLVEALVRTAVECFERDLHIRDKWSYFRATKTRPGYWYAGISAGMPRGMLEALMRAQDRGLDAIQGLDSTSLTRRYAAV